MVVFKSRLESDVKVDQLSRKAFGMKRWRHGERGQSLLEFALAAPVLVLVLLGMAELGNGLNSSLTVLASARDAARLGAEGGASNSAMLTLVQKETARLSGTIPTSASSCTPNVPSVCITNPSIGGGAGLTTSVRVKVCYNHALIIGVPPIPDPILICSHTTMRIAT